MTKVQWRDIQIDQMIFIFNGYKIKYVVQECTLFKYSLKQKPIKWENNNIKKKMLLF